MRPFAVALCAIAFAFTAPAQSATPKSTFVIAKDLADIITMDPGEVFELTAGEVIANLYDRIMMFEAENLTELVGGVAESYAVSEDGKTITFRIRDGLEFHSGNPVRPEDVEFSLERVIKLKKTPSFIVTQFGWNESNVDDLIEVVDDRHVRVTIVEDFSPVLVLNALSAGIASVVDKELVLANEVDGDLGNQWLKTNSAGSGAFSLKSWQANETVVLDANPDYRHGAPGMQRIILRHVPEPSAQRLLLEKGDIDLARNLTPDQVKGIEGNPDIAIDVHPKGTVVYLAANDSHPILGKDEVVQAIRHAIDYHAMADTFLAGQFVVHQAFWPAGLWAAYTETPYRRDIAKAKSLLEQAGHGDGFEVRIDTLTSSPYPEIAQSIQATLAQAGIKSTITTQEGKTLWPKYRARKHELNPRPLVARLRGPALQRRRLRPQPGQPCGSEAHRRARVAQRVGGGRDQRHDGCGTQRARSGQARAALPRPPEAPSDRGALRDPVPAKRAGRAAHQRRGLRVRLELRSGLLPQRDEVTGGRKAGGMVRTRSCGRRADHACPPDRRRGR